MMPARQQSVGQPDAKADVRILIVDDHPGFLAALRDVIAAAPGFAVIGEASSGEEAVRAFENLAPEFVLMDVAMPGIGGIAAARVIRRRQPTVAVVLISIDDLVNGDDAEGESIPAVRKQDLLPGQLRRLWEQHRPAQ
jgi:chemotaxis response regulator CheB